MAELDLQNKRPKAKEKTPSWKTKPLRRSFLRTIRRNARSRSRSSGSGQFPPAHPSGKAGKWARASAPIPEEGPAAGTEEPEGTTATGSEGPGETGAAGALGEIMAIHARDGQIQGLCSLVDHLGKGSSLTWAISSQWIFFSTHLSVEIRRGME